MTRPADFQFTIADFQFGNRKYRALRTEGVADNSAAVAADRRGGDEGPPRRERSLEEVIQELQAIFGCPKKSLCAIGRYRNVPDDSLSIGRHTRGSRDERGELGVE